MYFEDVGQNRGIRLRQKPLDVFEEFLTGHVSPKQFLLQRRYPVRLRVPSLVEHCSLPSLAGNDRQGVRRSVCFQAAHPVPDLESHVDTPPAWPQFYQRCAFLRVNSDQEAEPRTLSGDQLAGYLGTSRGLLRLIAKKAFPVPVLSDGWSVAGLRFVRELSVGSFCLGWLLAQRGTDPQRLARRTPIHDAVMRSFIESALGDDETIRQWAGGLAGLLDGCWVALREGMRRARGRPTVVQHTTAGR